AQLARVGAAQLARVAPISKHPLHRLAAATSRLARAGKKRRRSARAAARSSRTCPPDGCARSEVVRITCGRKDGTAPPPRGAVPVRSCEWYFALGGLQLPCGLDIHLGCQ